MVGKSFPFENEMSGIGGIEDVIDYPFFHQVDVIRIEDLAISFFQQSRSNLDLP